MVSPVSKQQANELVLNANQVTWLLQQGSVGHHPLFDIPTIRRALASDCLPEEPGHAPMLARLEETVKQLAALPDITEQRRFIGTQPEHVQDVLINLYFRLLDQYMHRSEATLH